MQYQVSEQ